MSFGIKIKSEFEWITVPDEEPYHELLKVLQERDIWIYGPIFQYTDEELLAAPYCVFRGGYTSGYPKPEKSYLEKTFDTSRMCLKCTRTSANTGLQTTRVTVIS